MTFSDEERVRFVRAHTHFESVPLVPELRVLTCSVVSALWPLAAEWLGDDTAPIPFWAAPWAGGQALARYLLDHPACVRGLRVLDFGCGGGLVALAAARAGAAHVQAVDLDPLAAVAARLNAAANGAALQIAVADPVGESLPEVDVLLAGDLWYEPGTAARLEPWLRALAGRGVRVLTADPGRAYVPRQATELARYQVPTSLELESALLLTARVLELHP